MSKQNIANARKAFVSAAAGANGAALVYALTLMGADKATMEAEREACIPALVKAGVKEATAKAYWSAIAKVAGGKAEGDANAKGIFAYAYGTQTSKAKKAAAKKPAAPVAKGGTAAELFAAFLALPAKERALARAMIVALKE